MTSNIILLLLSAAIIAILMVFFQYFYKVKDKSNTIFLLALLRFLSIFTLFVLLINPKFKSNEYKNIKPALNVLIDNSSSIAYAKEQVHINTMVDQLKSNTSINEKFNVNYYAFGDDLYLQDTFTYNNSETNIINALKSLGILYKEQVAPSILITDGIQTQGNNYTYYNSKQPVYPVIVGDTIQYDDLIINQINVNAYTTLNNKFPVEIFVQYDGDIDVDQTITIYSNNKLVYKKALQFSKKKSSKKIQFNLPANAVGVQNYSCRISTLNKEKNKINNRKNFSIEVVNEQAKILILSDINHPDISMLKRIILSNKQHTVFVENNLTKNHQYKDYQLIIIYQPSSKFTKIFTDIEREKVNYFTITGTATDWNFLNKAQGYFTKKNINKTEYYAPEFNLDYNEFVIEDIGFSDFSPLDDYFGEIDFSVPFQTILFQNISNFSTKNPLWSTFSDQNRRGAVLFGENSWKWRMQSHIREGSFLKFDNFFNKIIQYLSSTKKYNRIEIDYLPFIYTNKDAIIKAQFFDANYIFDKNENLTLSLKNKRTNETKKFPFTLKNYHYEVILSNLQSDDYIFSVSDNEKKLTKHGAFTVLPYNIEQQMTTANTKDLKKLANASKGSFYPIANSETLISQLLADKRYQTIQKSQEKIISLIDWKWLLAVGILFFSLEWFLRKYHGKI